PLLLPRLARMELRPRDDVARSPALRLFPGPVERRDRGPVRAPGAGASAAQPGGRSVYRPDWRAAHHARLLPRDLHGGRLVHVRAGLLDAARGPGGPDPSPRGLLAGDLGDGERAAGGARRAARAAE